MQECTHREKFSPARLKEARGSMSQERFAALIGVVGRTVAAWERGESTPKADTLARIAAATGRSVVFFFERAA